MTRIEEIYEFVLPEMKANDIEDTTFNRMLFLEGLRDGWKEDSETSLEKSLYMIAINGEIFILKMKLHNEK
jgi:hypothetical protein